MPGTADVTPLTPVERLTLKTAAFGAVHLLSVAYPGAIATSKINMVGAKVLTGATGLVGEILSDKQKIKLKGNTGEIADEVLPALSSTVAVLKEKAPDEVENFRTIVTTAMRQAVPATSANPAQTVMTDKIQAALAG